MASEDTTIEGSGTSEKVVTKVQKPYLNFKKLFPHVGIYAHVSTRSAAQLHSMAIGFRGWVAGIHAWPNTARIPAAHPRSTAAMRQWVRLPPMHPSYVTKFRANLLHWVEIRLHKKFRAP